MGCNFGLTSGNVSSLISRIGGTARHTPVIVVSRRDNWQDYLAALAAGATGYVAFPPYPREVEQSLETAVRTSAAGTSLLRPE